MNLFTLDLSLFGLTLDNFLIVVIAIVLTLMIIGIILMARNIRPILGLLLLIFAVAMIIGVSYDEKGLKRELNKFWSNVTKEKVEVPEILD